MFILDSKMSEKYRQCEHVLAHKENMYLFLASQILYITYVLALTHLSLY